MAGFLRVEAEAWKQQIRERSSGWFELAEATNEFCHRLLLKLEPHKNIGVEVLSAILFKRILCAFQAVVILTERGMFTEAKAQRRSMLEALFVLGGIWQQPELVSIYVRNDQHRRLKVYQNIKKLSKEARERFNVASDDEIEKHIAELSAATKGVQYLSVESFAQAAHLHDLYLSDYSVLSEVSHHVAKDLEQTLELNAHDEIKGLQWGPEDGSPFHLLFPAVDQMVMAAHVAGKLFSIDIEDERDTLSARSRALSGADEKANG